jgi:Fe-S oxidoreductase
MGSDKGPNGYKIEKNDRCCGESGTLAVTRPDVSTQIRFRKEEEMRKGEAQVRAAGMPAASGAAALAAIPIVGGAQAPASETNLVSAVVPFEGDVKILTSCPSCLQGLSRYGEDVKVEADYIVVEMAKAVLGENWMVDYVAKANAGGIERVLV